MTAGSGPLYRVRDDVLTAELEGEAVVLNMDSRTYFQLNATAAAAWKLLEDGISRADLVGHLCTEFEVEPDEAAREVDRLLEELVTAELIQPVDGESG